MTVYPKNACKLEFSGHLWLTFIDQQQSDVVFFVIITINVYIILVKKLKRGMCSNDIIIFNEDLENIST